MAETAFRWVGDSAGRVQFEEDGVEACSADELISHLRTRANRYSDEDLALLAACALAMAIREARFNPAGRVLEAAWKVLDSAHPILDNPSHEAALQRGFEELERYVAPARAKPGHVLLDWAFHFLTMRCPGLGHVPPSLPPHLLDRVAQFPESSYGAHRIIVTLDDGREFRDVYVAWGAEIVRVGTKEHVPFDPYRIVSVRRG